MALSREAITKSKVEQHISHIMVVADWLLGET